MKEDIVITGISGRFPCSDSMDELRDNLFNGIDMVTEDDQRWPPGLYSLPKRSGKLGNLSKFDAEFFGIHSEQTRNMDIQQRFLLELAFEAVLDAGVNPSSLCGTNTAVMIASGFSETLQALSEEAPDTSGFAYIGCDPALIANRISYYMDLKGPSCSLSTTCSSGGMALYNAFNLLQNGKCDAALVGGSMVQLSPGSSLSLQNFLSPDGKCKFLDQTANGFVRSESCCMIFLQKSSQAKRIYATVLGIESNTDGYKEDGFTYPSSRAHYQLLKNTLREANVDPNSVHYIECHGTGTQAGDQNEIEGITRAYCEDRSDGRPLLVGSVKTNVGHTEYASCLVSIAKVLIAFENNLIAANLHYNSPNLSIPSLVSGVIQPVVKNTELNDNSIVGINSFGAGGSNVHILLRPKPRTVEEDIPDKIPRIIPLFGRTEQNVRSLLQFFVNEPQKVTKGFLKLFNDIAVISGMKFRDYILLGDNLIKTQLYQKIERVGDRRPLWFIFTGMGCEWPAMAKSLMNIDIFKDSIHKSHTIMKEFGLDLISLLTTEESNQSNHGIIENLMMITTMQIGLVDLLSELNITPDGIAGHSLGEVATGYCDGALDRKQALLVTYWRARVVTEVECPKAMMITVKSTWEECQRRCPSGLVFPSCHNSKNSVTISGRLESMEVFLEQLNRDNVFAKQLKSYGFGFHSPLVSPISQLIKEKLTEIIPNPKLRSPKWISSSIPEQNWNCNLAKYCSADYLTNNMLSPVLFYEALQHVPNNSIVIEISPHTLFQGIVKSILGSECTYIPLMKRNNNNGNLELVLSLIGDLYKLGFNPELNKLYPNSSSFPVNRGTQSISSLIKWDHSEDWFVPLYPNYFLTKNQVNSVIDISKNKDNFYTDYQIDGQIVFPFAGYVVMVWQMLARIEGKSIDHVKLDLDELVIHHQVTLNHEKPNIFTIKFDQKIRQVSVNEQDVIVFTVNLGSEISGLLLGYDRGINQSVFGKMEIKGSEFYRELKLRGYDFGPNFRAVKTICTGNGNAHVAFNSNWVRFIDALLQTCILSLEDRDLNLPVYIQSLHCDPTLITKQFNDNSNQEIIIDVYHDESIQTITAKGVQISLPKFKKTQRIPNQNKPTIEKYIFYPNSNEIQNDEFDPFIRDLNNLAVEAMDRLNHHHDNDNKQNKIEHGLVSVLNDLGTESNDLTMINLINQLSEIGENDETMESIWNRKISILNKDQFFHILHPMVDLIFDNLVTDEMNILEITLDSNEPTCDIVKCIVENLPGLDIKIKYTITNPINDIVQCQQNESFSIDQLFWETSSSKIYPTVKTTVDIFILRNTDFQNMEMIDFSDDKLAQFILTNTNHNGFIIALFRTNLTPCEKLINDVLKIIPSTNNLVLTKNLINMGCCLVSKVTFSKLITVILLRKSTPKLVLDQTFIEVKSITFEWISSLKCKLREHQSRPEGHNIWLIANDCPFNGIIGLINCLRREPGGERIRCLVIEFDATNDIQDNRNTSFKPILYADIIRKDLVINVIRDGRLGTYRYLNYQNQLKRELQREDCFHAFFGVTDTSGLQWIESQHKYWPIGRENNQKLIYINYSSINTRDLKAFKNINDHEGNELDNMINVNEFVGLDNNKAYRLMGMVKSNSTLSTTIVINSDNDLLWMIPDNWSLEDAIGVPLAYVTAYYLLFIRARIETGMSLLILTGSRSAIAQAVINICLKIKCKVYLNVDNEEQFEGYARLFPQLRERIVVNFRQNALEMFIKRETNGKCFDIILNLTQRNNIKCSRLLSDHGKLLEMMNKEQNYDIEQVNNNTEIHRVDIERLFDHDDNSIRIRNRIHKLVAEGMRSGEVLPVMTKVFDVNQIEEAFRYMSSGEPNMDRVVVRLKKEDSDGRLTVRAKHRTMFYSNKSYIIIGSLVGFGLELFQWMVNRGAKKFVSVSKNGIRNRYQQWVINKIRRRAEILIRVDDISKYDRCENIISLANEMGDVGGVFNLDMLSQDLISIESSHDYLEAVSDRTDAIINMDKLCRIKCSYLEYFVQFSSILSGRGIAGQPLRGYAHSVAEQICEMRRRDGFHGLAIQWGPIEDFEDKEKIFDGFLPQTIDCCLEVLDQILVTNESVLSSYIKAFRTEGKVIQERTSLLQQICNILGIRDPSALNMSTTLSELGMDSLMAIDIKEVIDIYASKQESSSLESLSDLKSLKIDNILQMSMT